MQLLKKARVLASRLYWLVSWATEQKSIGLSTRHDVQKIRKTCGGDGCGHCWEGTGWVKCDFYNTDEMEKGGENAARCDLFGGVYKWSSQSLSVCDKIYGRNYDGAP